VADRFFIGVPFLAVAPIVGGDLEALEGDLLAALEAPKLLFLADRQPELEHHHPVARHRALEIVDLAVARSQSASAANLSTRSTSTRPYQERSKNRKRPRRGKWRQKRQR
jgi:hypothetical protein